MARRPGAAERCARPRRVRRSRRGGGAALRFAGIPGARRPRRRRAGNDAAACVRGLCRLGRGTARERARPRRMDHRGSTERRRVHGEPRELCGRTCCAARAASTSSSRAFPTIRRSTSKAEIELGHVRQLRSAAARSRECAHTLLDVGAHIRSTQDAMKLIDTTRSTSPCSSRGWACSNRKRSLRSNNPLSASSVFQLPCFRRGVSPLERVDDLRERRLQMDRVRRAHSRSAPARRRVTVRDGSRAAPRRR